jgi:SAM-dependent methyltransferase
MDQYNRMRVPLSSLVLFSLIQYFKPKSILEMGFFEGKTFGIMLEAASENCELTAIDIEYRMKLFDKYYAKSNVIKNKKINLLTVNSLEFNSNSTFDFINVDTGGGESIPSLRCHDLNHAAQLLTKDGILMLDDYKKCETFIPEFLQTYPTIKPFLIDSQALYFHYETHDANYFLDTFIKQVLPAEFANISNINIGDCSVTEIKSIPIYIDHNRDLLDLFKSYCKIKNF